MSTANAILNKKNLKYVYIAASIVGTIIIVKQGKNLLDKWKLDRTKALLDTNVTATNASGQSVNIDLGSTAAEIDDAFFNNDWFGASEDEERAIIALLAVPDEYISALSDIYYKLYKRILKADFVSYLSDEEYMQVKDKFI